jgi:ABC-type multidrug transport system ATPase subunit
MDEAERCNEIGYIFNAKLTIQGTPSYLKALPEVSPPGTRRIAVATSQPPAALALLKREPYVEDATLVEAEIHLLLPSDVEDARVISTLEKAGMTHVAVRATEPSLEDVFVSVTRRLEAQ